ncbi:MAG: hypothetical protein H0U40_02400 [Chloroflexia bacterium]|nr:hypothetical protein [Chloroflexia bacterium]
MVTRVAATLGLVIMLLMGAIGAPSPASAAGSDLVANGGFEDPVVNTGSFAVLNAILGWTLAYGPGIEVQNRVAGTPNGGNQHVELDSRGSSAMYQDIATVPGVSYTVSFWVSPRPNVSAADNVLSASWDGGVLETISSGLGGSETVWVQYAYSVTATSSLTRLQFADVGVSNSLGSYLDDVSVVEVQYGICTLYDASKPVKSGATKPIKLQLCDSAGNNLSSPSLVLHAVNLIKVDGTVTSTAVEDAGQANPDWDFRYDADLAGYIYNLSTGGLTTGTWQLLFTVNGGQTVYGANFDVK